MKATIDLRPACRQKQSNSARRQRFFVAAALLLSLALLASGLYYRHLGGELQAEIARCRQAIADSEDQCRACLRLQQELGARRQLVELVEYLSSSRFNWRDLMLSISDAAAPAVELTSFTVTGLPHFSLNGTAATLQSVGRFYLRLQDLEAIETVQLGAIERLPDGYSFQLSGSIIQETGGGR